MTQTHKIRPSADRLVAWSDEEEAQMRAAVAACDGFIESRFPGEQPCYEQTAAQPMRYTRHNRWYDYTDTAPAQQDEPTPDTQRGKPAPDTQRGKLAEHLDEIRKMCADPGYSNADIAERFGVGRAFLGRFIRVYGIKVTRYNHTLRVMLDNRKAIRQWLAQGVKPCQIAKQLHVDAYTLSKFIKKHNLTPKKSKLKK